MITNIELIEIIEKVINKKLYENEKEEICTFYGNLTNNFKEIKKLISNSELTKKEEKFSNFRIQYLEKITFLNFIEQEIFPLNLKNLKNLKIGEHLKTENIQKIEISERVYSLYESLREDLIEDDTNISKKEYGGIKIINIQHLYNNFDDSFMKEQVVKMNNMNKLDFDYWDLTKTYDIKDMAILNASRIVSAIDYFFNDKIFIYRKTKGSKFEKIKIKYKENNEIYNGTLEYAEGLEKLSTGWNIIISKDLKIYKNPYQYVSERKREVKFIGKNNYNSILDNSHYSQKIFTKNSKYISLELLTKNREEEFDNRFLIKILNHVQSFPIKIDSWVLKKSVNINMRIYKEIEKLKNSIKYSNKTIKWSEKKKINKILRNTYNKIEGYENDIENNNQILKLSKALENKTFYINYMFCTRYRMYPNAGVLNYQNFKVLRLIFRGETIEKQKIIDTYKKFLEKHKDVKEEILKNIFFYNKINTINYDKIIKIVSDKIGREVNISRWEEDKNLWDIIICNIAFHLIIRIGGTEKKISTYNNDDEVIEEGFIKIKNVETLNKNIYEERLAKDWIDFSDRTWITQKLYSFDATTSMIQISSIICFADNKKILKQCGIINPFEDNNKIEDSHESILINVKEKIKNFIEKNNIKKYENEIKNLLDRKFIKTIHIPFSYGQGERTLLQNVNKKQRNNEIWENIPTKLKKMICRFVYEEILNIYENELMHILEARNVFEEAYRESSISMGGEIIKMPVQTDISDIHIEYWELVKKRKNIINSFNNIKENDEFQKEKRKELLRKIDSIDTRIDKIEMDYEEKDLIKRINISSILWDKKSENFKTVGKYKVLYLKQNTNINKEKMDRCAYVNSVQNGDANVMLMTNDKLMLDDYKIITLWAHDCGNVPLAFADLFEISYKMSLMELTEYYLNPKTDPIERKIYCIDKTYIEKRKKRKEFWIKNNIKGEIWKSSRVVTADE